MKLMRTLVPCTLLLGLFALGCQSGPEDGAEAASVPYGLTVSPAHDPQVGSYVIVTGLIPPKYPDEERLFSAVLVCGRRWRPINPSENERYEVFVGWADTAGVTLDAKGMTYGDLAVTCEADSSLRFKGKDFGQALGLLAADWSGDEKLDRGASEGGSTLQFHAGGQDIDVSVGPSEVTRGAGEVTAAPGTLVARQGTSQAELAAGAGAFPYNPADTLRLVVGRRDSLWDVVTLHYEQGWFNWKQVKARPL